MTASRQTFSAALAGRQLAGRLMPIRWMPLAVVPALAVATFGRGLPRRRDTILVWNKNLLTELH